VVGAAIQAFAQAFAGFEERQAFRLDLYSLARSGVAARAGIAGFNGEGTEATKLNPIASGERGRDFIEDGIYNLFNVAQEQMGVALRQFLNEFGFGHGHRSPCNLLIYNQNDAKQGFASSKTLIEKDILLKTGENRGISEVF